MAIFPITHDVACEFACAVAMRSSNGRERPQGAFYLNLSEILNSFIEGLKGEKMVLEHHQTVQLTALQDGTPGCGATIWCASTKSSNLQNFYKKFTKQPRILICGMSGDILDCLKLERGI